MNNDEDQKIKSKIELVMELAELVAQIGWVIAVPNDEQAPGLIIGTHEYVTDVVNVYYGAENVEILEKDERSDMESPSFEVGEEVQEDAVEILDMQKKKPILH